MAIGLLVGLVILLGLIGGYIGAIRSITLGRRVNELQERIDRIYLKLDQLRLAEHPREAVKPAVSAVPPATGTGEAGEREEALSDAALPTVPPPPPPPAVKPAPAPAAKMAPVSQENAAEIPPVPAPFQRSWDNVDIEQFLGLKGIIWAGVLMLLVGGGLFLKYMYDNNWLGPMGRDLLMAVASACAIGLGEAARRKKYGPLFHALTGGGVAGLYTSLYFVLNIHHLASPGAVMALSVGVTVFALCLAVLHNAQTIALLALGGGLLSPVLFSSGENRPHALFLYVIAVDLVAVGAALFRKWRWVNTAALAGSWLLYSSWFATYYAADQRVPALLYATAFYAIFLCTGTANGLVRREKEGIAEVAVALAATFAALAAYYRVFMPDGRITLGFVVLAQAAATFGLYLLWQRRVRASMQFSRTLLVTAMALTMLAIPLQVRHYGIPIAWAAQAVLLAYVGGMYRDGLVRLGGVAALALAVCGLLAELPLHSEAFMPLANTPFLAWAWVAGAAALTALLLRRETVLDEEIERSLALLCAGGACVIITAALSMEDWLWWQVGRSEWLALTAPYQAQSLALLWAVITGAAWLGLNRFRREWKALSLLPAAVLVMCVLAGFGHYQSGWTGLCLNTAFLAAMLAPAVIWLLARDLSDDPIMAGTPPMLVVAGHVLLAVACAVELHRWSIAEQAISTRTAISLMSVVWGVHALCLVVGGLATRVYARRALGMGMFGVVIMKVILYDTSTLQQHYRILSWVGCGLLLMVAGYFYHRFSAVLTVPEKDGETKP